MSAASNFPACLKLVLEHEGGYVNHPKDPGGETNKGVTRRVYDAYRRSVGKHVQSVRHISAAEVATIYERDYWNPVKGDGLGHGVDFATFDFAVNSGVSRASRYLQACVGAAQDGKIGPATLRLVGLADAVAVVKKLYAKRMGFLRSLATFTTFGRGWSRRCAKGEADSLAMIASRSMLKAEAERAVAASKSQSKAAAATGAGAAGAGGAGATQVDPAGLDLVSTGGLVAAVVVVALVVAFLVARSRVNRDRADAHLKVAESLA